MAKINKLLRYGTAMILLLLAGCSAHMTKPEWPQVSVTSITLVDPGLLEQRFRVQLRVQNPNSFDLPIDGINLRLDLNGQQFVTGMSAAPVTVPRFGSAFVEVDAVSTLAAFAGQLEQIVSNKAEAVRYSLSGKVHLSRPSMSLPFNREGEISFIK